MKTTTKVWTLVFIIAVALLLFLSMRPLAPTVSPSPTPESTKALPQVYVNQMEKFSLHYPTGYTPDEKYTYQAQGPGKSIPGVKFTIPASLTKGTNLSPDSYLSLEWIHSAINSCSAEIYLSDPRASGFVDMRGHRYSVASSSGAAAGNRYDEVVYATPSTQGCIAVRYFVHYGAIQNYPAGTVKEFDKQELMAQFDAIRETLTLGQ